MYVKYPALMADALPRMGCVLRGGAGRPLPRGAIDPQAERAGYTGRRGRGRLVRGRGRDDLTSVVRRQAHHGACPYTSTSHCTAHRADGQMQHGYKTLVRHRDVEGRFERHLRELQEAEGG